MTTTAKPPKLKPVPKTKKARCRRFSVSSAMYDDLMRLPGYDPFRDAHETGGPFVFNEAKALRAIGFFRDLLTHVKGEMAKKPFILEPWQRAVIANLWGWRDGRGKRRYRYVFVYVPKKNGKTTFAAGILHLVQMTDGEPGAEIYGLASSKEQAAKLYEQAIGMVRNEPELDRRLKIYGARGGGQMKSIVYERSTQGKVTDVSSYRVIAADADSADGANVHCAVADELHRFKKREIIDVLELSTVARSQPLIIYTTTADFNRPSICNEKLARAHAVCSGTFPDPRFLPVVFEAANDDDWTSPKVWRKANPNLDVTFPESVLAEKCRSALETPTEQNNFKRLHLNIVTDADVVWIPREAWVGSAGPLTVTELRTRLIGRECYGGLDLSEKRDITAFVLVFPKLAEPGGAETELAYDWLGWFFIPADNAIKREERDGVQYLTWAREGYIELTEGDIVDHAVITAKIVALSKQYDIRGLGYDKWNASQLATQLYNNDSLPMVEVTQGFKSLSEPSKLLEALVHGGRFHHGGHPIMEWMIANTMVQTDAAGNIKPNKAKSTGRIDGVSATVTALARALLRQESGSSLISWIEDEE